MAFDKLSGANLCSRDGSRSLCLCRSVTTLKPAVLLMLCLLVSIVEACPPDQHLYEGDCYEIFVSKDKEYHEARDECRVHHPNGDLPVIRKVEDENFLRSIIDEHYDYWLGFRDPDDDGIYTWVDNSILVETGYTNWKSESESGSKECAIMRRSENFKWDSVSCGNDYEYICRYPGVTTPAPTTTISTTFPTTTLLDTTTPYKTTVTPQETTSLPTTSLQTTMPSTTSGRTTAPTPAVLVETTTTQSSTRHESSTPLTTLQASTDEARTTTVATTQSTPTATPAVQQKGGMSAEEVRRQVPYLTITSMLAIVVAVIVVLDLIFYFGRNLHAKMRGGNDISLRRLSDSNSFIKD
ncbi:uncharacterized protein [Ptychodera flava]|uniref:uncharacterized protein n=1 Tax=Ptychodera flava TaxID=63121 RepID=UPI003969D0C3